MSPKDFEEFVGSLLCVFHKFIEYHLDKLSSDEIEQNKKNAQSNVFMKATGMLKSIEENTGYF